ncbi:protein phosphatase 1 regulatory subunit 3B [Chrysoperla carnea]|uniref:protein phosphatase 1 regulatory subunit 3B n=1 Tax=Chrysoperla carnea TaxID=189513 RepID=UPI001D072B5D|nr:protein phosphatase 1 regulatory subunit 3B [Chrysoperla carnea]
MSTLVMPADYEMLVSRSPPTAYNHSPPAGFLIDYCNTQAFVSNKSKPLARVVHANTTASINLKQQSFPIQTKPVPIRSASFNQITIPSSNTNTTPPASPKRPCLVVRSPPNNEESSANNEDNNNEKNNENSKNKKKVIFADDRGMSLTQVRVMTEPSNVPPLWSLRFLSQVTKGICAEPLPEPWEITFTQPASDYINFRRKLDTENVSLENVIVRENEATVIGTVKVKNIAFSKEVIVRSTSDNWLTQEDTFCTFVSNNSQMTTGAVYVLYDTFSFKLTLPPKSRRIEFCVCFRCEGKEYWDSNKGKNYVLVKKAQISPTFQKSLSSDNLLKGQSQMNNKNIEDSYRNKYTDITQTNVTTWSEFASWTHLDTNGPYY